MKSQLLILRNNSGYARITPYGRGMRVVLSWRGAEGEAWVKVGEVVRHRPIKDSLTLDFDLSGEVSVAVKSGGEVFVDTRSRPYIWAEIMAPKAPSEPIAAPLDTPPAEPVQPLVTPPVEVIDLEPETPPKPLGVEEMMADRPEVEALSLALPGARFVAVKEEEGEYVLGTWVREDGVHLGYGVKGDKNRPLDGGQLVSTQEGDYWIIWQN